MGLSNKEMQLQRNCRLYAYVLSSLGKDIPEYIDECLESDDYLIDCARELSALIKSLDAQTFEKLTSNAEVREAAELAYWWQMNQEANRLGASLTKTCL